jgi:hypothetical protein
LTLLVLLQHVLSLGMPLEIHARRKRRGTDSSMRRKALIAVVAIIIAQKQLVIRYTQLLDELEDAALGDVSALFQRVSARSLARWHREPCFKSVDWWVNVVPKMSEARFRRNFRVSRQVAHAVFTGLDALPHFQMKKFSPRSKAKSLELKIAVTLWRLGSMRTECDAAEHFGVSSGFVHNACELVVESIVRTFGHVISSLLPVTAAARTAAAANMEALSTQHGRPGFTHCLGALDGTRIGIVRMPDIPAQQTYSKESEHTVALQAVADSKRRFIDIQVGQVGTVHDSYLLRTSQLWTRRNEWLVHPYFLLADTGYFLTPELILPFGRTESLPHLEKSRFNRALSSIRGVVECAFGILKNRFRILLNGGFRRAELGTVAKWILAACILHNMCISADDVSAPAVEPISSADGDDDDELDEFPDFDPSVPLETPEPVEAPGCEYGYDMAGLPVTGTDSLVAEGRRRRLQAFCALGFAPELVEEECDKAGCPTIWAFMNSLA